MEKKEKAKKDVAKLISERFPYVCGIVYCARHQDVVDIAHHLKESDVSTIHVHGTLSNTERSKHLEQWTGGNAMVMCATKCFGTGINKPDVRFIVHYTFCSCIEDYYQEIGRAGRDNLPACCITFIKFEDRSRQKIKTKVCKHKGMQNLIKLQILFPIIQNVVIVKSSHILVKKCLYVKICVMYALRIKEWQKHHGKIVKLKLPN